MGGSRLKKIGEGLALSFFVPASSRSTLKPLLCFIRRVLSVQFCCSGVFQAPSSQTDTGHTESDSSVEFAARRADATAVDDQVLETSHAATRCSGEADDVGPVSTDDGQRRRRASMGFVDSAPMSKRKSSVSSNAAEMLAKLMCVGRKMKLADDTTTTV